ncbi:MAG: NAD(P)/FAD-dependent oxidoreductase [Myxococcales bacterium]|nr:NAD(P)/FAD-dependent oxidoreductase [Myxococcales bacterium]
MPYDVAIIGGGPAGLSAALALGRARKRVLLCDSGPRRNAAAEQVHNFVTRDGTPPEEFRTIARDQLAAYPNVEVQDTHVARVSGRKGAFELAIAGGTAVARRVVLCVGMIDEMLPIEGFEELWGHAIFQCPYCHGWEVKERPWGYIARDPSMLHFAVMLRGWSENVTVFTQGAFDIDPQNRAHLEAAGVRVEASPILRLKARGHTLDGVELSSGAVVRIEALFVHPPQRHVDLVASLDLALDADGLVKVDQMTRETSLPGIYAAGDLASRAQAAILAAAAGTQAAGMLNHELTAELASAVP